MALVALAPERCPSCAADLTSVAWDQLPLLRHAGHGAAERTVRRSCPECGWALTAEVGEVRP